METKQEIPEIELPEVIRVEYPSKTRAIIFAKTDIREDLSKFLAEKGVTIVSLEIEEPSLEDIFLKTIYRRD